MKSYYTKLLFHPAFRQAPLATIFRLGTLIILSVFLSRVVVDMNFGGVWFKVYQYLRTRKQGGRGAFIFRERLEPLLQHGSRFIKFGDIVIDCGANQGVYSCAFAKYVGPDGHVIAIDPISDVLSKLDDNIKLNNLGNVTAVCAAVSDRKGVATLDMSRGFTSATIDQPEGSFDKASIFRNVPTVSIDSICKTYDLDCVNFIKVDVEGAELQTILGAAATLRKFKPILCMEMDFDTHDSSSHEVFELLSTFSYQAYVVNEGVMVKLSRSRAVGRFQNVFWLPQ